MTPTPSTHSLFLSLVLNQDPGAAVCTALTVRFATQSHRNHLKVGERVGGAYTSVLTSLSWLREKTLRNHSRGKGSI